jgi:hypothetical protein
MTCGLKEINRARRCHSIRNSPKASRAAQDGNSILVVVGSLLLGRHRRVGPATFLNPPGARPVGVAGNPGLKNSGQKDFGWMFFCELDSVLCQNRGR